MGTHLLQIDASVLNDKAKKLVKYHISFSKPIYGDT